jgi:hypothetical protein
MDHLHLLCSAAVFHLHDAGANMENVDNAPILLCRQSAIIRGKLLDVIDIVRKH